MKDNGSKEKMAKTSSYAGAGIGLVLFAIFGLLPGSLLGGTVGLKIAGQIFGSPVVSGVIPRIVVGISLLVGVMFSCAVFVLVCTALGWLVGVAVDTLRTFRKGELEGNTDFR